MTKRIRIILWFNESEMEAIKRLASDMQYSTSRVLQPVGESLYDTTSIMQKAVRVGGEYDVKIDRLQVSYSSYHDDGDMPIIRTDRMQDEDNLLALKIAENNVMEDHFSGEGFLEDLEKEGLRIVRVKPKANELVEVDKTLLPF